MKAEVERLSAFCLDHGNCYGKLQVRVWVRVRGGGAAAQSADAGSLAGALPLPPAAPSCRPHAPPLLQTPQAEVRHAAKKLLPPSAAQDASARGSTYIAVTYPSDSGDGADQQLVNTYSSKDDMIKALEASTYIPYYAGPRMTTRSGVGWGGDGAASGSGGQGLPAGPGRGGSACSD
jgi:hypothetical protein